MALELRIDADLALARHGELVGELEQLLGQHPWRERLAGQLMLAILARTEPAKGGRRLLALVNDIKPAPAKLDRLVVKSGGRVFFLRTDELDWIEAAGNYVRLHLGEESHLFRETMNRMEARLDGRRLAWDRESPPSRRRGCLPPRLLARHSQRRLRDVRHQEERGRQPLGGRGRHTPADHVGGRGVHAGLEGGAPAEVPRRAGPVRRPVVRRPERLGIPQHPVDAQPALSVLQRDRCAPVAGRAPARDHGRAGLLQQLDGAAREPALRELGGAFHEQHRGTGPDMGLDSTDYVFCHDLSPLLERSDERPLRFRAHNRPRRDFIHGAQTTHAPVAVGQYTDFDARGWRAFNHDVRPTRSALNYGGSSPILQTAHRGD